MSHDDSVTAVVPAFAVDRPALVERLGRAVQRRVVLVVAPAGYGKSVLLAQWAAEYTARPVVWTAARAPDDAVAFGRRLGAVVESLVPGAAARIQGVLSVSGASLGPEAVGVIATELATGPPAVVVIEDLDSLSEPELRRDLSALAARVPPGFTFVLVSRDDRFPQMEGLRLRDEVAEIRQSDLALSCEDLVDVVEAMGGPELTPPVAAALHDRTEGWAAGVQLAALGLRDHEDPGGFVADFAGDDRHLADYLSGEVLARQSPETTEFLLRTSVLDRLSGPICEALTGIGNGQQTLERLDREGLFLRPLDRHREWFAYHPLFRDLLRYELRAGRSGEAEALLIRAAAWHLARDETDEAVEYLLRANDWPAVVELVHRVGSAKYHEGQAATVVRWLEQLPRERLFDPPDTAVALAVALTACGRALAAQDLVEQVEAAVVLDTPNQAVVACLRLTWTWYHAPPETAAAPMALLSGLTDREIERPAGPLLGVFTPARLRGLALVAAAIADSLQGDYERARPLLLRSIEASGEPLWAIHALGEQAWIDASTGHLREALAGARRALAIADELGLGPHAGTAIAHFALARTHRERGETTVVAHIDAGLSRARSNARTRVLAVAWAERAHQALVDRRIGDGLSIIEQSETSGGPPLPAVEQARLAALKARLHLLAGDAGSARLAIEAHRGLVTVEVASASAALASALGDSVTLRKVLDDWPVVTGPSATWSRSLWSAVLAEAEGDRREALRLMEEAVAAAEPEGAVRPFLDGDRRVHRLVRALYHRRPTPFLRRLVDELPPAVPAHSPDLVVQLTEREVAVLRYLPSRLANADIAEALYVSVNTLKTHLKSIYRKLDVRDRGGAIDRAEALGLL